MTGKDKMTSDKKERTVLLVTNIPTPYRIPLFIELHKQLQEKGMRLKVLFGAKGYTRRKWEIDFSEFEFDYQILDSPQIRLFNKEKVMFTYPGLFRILKRDKPEVVITNAFSIASTKLWFRSFIPNTPPYIIWSGAIPRPERADGWLRKIQRRVLIKRAAGFISYGTLAKRYLITLGAPEDKVTIAFNTVDTEYFAKETARIRETLPVDEKKHLLYVGDLSPRKNVIKLLKVAEALKNIRSDFILDLVGDGHDLGMLNSHAIENSLENVICFHGFKQKNELPRYYARADCFLFQTDFDIWGLVLVEAMAAGVPCIASIHAGATYDLIHDGMTGFAADYWDYETIVNKINWIFEHQKDGEKMGENAKKNILEIINIEVAAKGFLKAIYKIIN